MTNSAALKAWHSRRLPSLHVWFCRPWKKDGRQLECILFSPSNYLNFRMSVKSLKCTLNTVDSTHKLIVPDELWQVLLFLKTIQRVMPLFCKRNVTRFLQNDSSRFNIGDACCAFKNTFIEQRQLLKSFQSAVVDVFCYLLLLLF